MGRTTSSSKFMNQVRCIVLDMFENGTVLELPKGRYVKQALSEERVKALRDITYIVMLSDITSLETKKFMSNPYIKYSGVAEEIGIETGVKPKISTVQTRIWSDKNKLVSALGEDIIVDLVEIKSNNVQGYLDNIAVLMSKINKEDLLKNINLKFPNKTIYCDSITDEEFEDFMEIIIPYTKNYMNRIANSIDTRVLSYIQYIQSHNELSDIDRQRYTELKEATSIGLN